VNDGLGKFHRNKQALPEEFSNGSCVRAADYDQDGDLDLFVGGRSLSGAYPFAPQSFLLENHKGQFFDVTSEACPALQHSGMITDALWTDFDNDGQVDLITTGEWMPISFYKNVGGNFNAVTTSSGIQDHVGWWNSLAAGDFDNDGDMDYIAGNLGLNSIFKATSHEPMTVFAKDLNQDGKIDPMIFCYMKGEDGNRKPYPMHTRDDMITQLVSIRKTYPTYKSFGRATVDELWSKDSRMGALHYEANDMQSSYIENMGNGKFSMTPLPLEAQMAPLYGMMAEDINGDGNLDLILTGNDFGMEPFSGRHDAFNGLCMTGNGKGKFMARKISETGFYVPGDAKAFVMFRGANREQLFLVTENLGSLHVFKNKNSKSKWISLEKNIFCAEIIYQNGVKRKMEFYYGSTYLSQSSRHISIDPGVESVILKYFDGKNEVLTF
jgi:hypothetical protein